MTQPFSKSVALKSPRGLNLDIDGWLRSLGLERLIDLVLAESGPVPVLPNLTTEDLKDLGVG
jgi:SAM domain (Sterile alpha motif)